ncbi:CLUMA_CG016888, isoform A [Clunio marinus]|uniref:CLUMA_CG016888, isoform A n=1 Tax=Clunio marinus TaxID=568069 RepID=A0A1J1IT24_9DIPT|nr:CLUMA_CG016888, isoform A [Clunio marinus]
MKIRLAINLEMKNQQQLAFNGALHALEVFESFSTCYHEIRMQSCESNFKNLVMINEKQKFKVNKVNFLTTSENKTFEKFSF